MKWKVKKFQKFIATVVRQRKSKCIPLTSLFNMNIHFILKKKQLNINKSSNWTYKQYGDE